MLCKKKGDTLNVNGKRITPNSLHDLPEGITLEAAKTVSVAHGITLAGEHSFLSNMAKSEIKIGHQTYYSAEQAITHARAIKCNQLGTAAAILRTTSPFACKAQARSLKTDTWDTQKLDIVKDITITKFEQHPVLLEQLLDTDHKDLFEFTRDRYRGVGFPISQCYHAHLAQFGDNQFGKILMQVREKFASERR